MRPLWCSSPRTLKPKPQTLLFSGRVEPALPSPGSCQRGRFSAALSGRGGHRLGAGRGSLCFDFPQSWAGCGDPKRLLASLLLLRGRPSSRCRTVLLRAARQLHHPAARGPQTLFLPFPAVHSALAGAICCYVPLPSLSTKGSGWRLQVEFLPKQLCACVAPSKPRLLPDAPPCHPGLHR